MAERLQKILAACGIGSRRAAEALIRAGRVRVNGRVAQLGESADPERDRIEVDGHRVRPREREVWVLHKPRGVLTTRRDPFGRPAVADRLPREAASLFPVGRLDKESEGLLLLTNDGDLAHVLLHPSWGAEREYRVEVEGVPSRSKLERIRGGVRLRDGRTARAEVRGFRPRSDRSGCTLVLVLREGRKRQIRRMLAALGHPVRRLVRTRVGPLRLGSLAPGEARPLRGEELEALRRYVERLRERSARTSVKAQHAVPAQLPKRSSRGKKGTSRCAVQADS